MTKVYANLHFGRVYNRTGYDVTIYYWSEVIDVRKAAENAAYDGFAVLYLENRWS